MPYTSRARSCPSLLERARTTDGGPIICRAYADWADSDLAPWFAQLREHGVQAIHNFDTPEHRRGLAALMLDALDLVERHGVTSLVLVGDLGAALPLVTRLRSHGVTVALVGPVGTPEDLRRSVDDFVEVASLDGAAASTARGRHRA